MTTVVFVPFAVSAVVAMLSRVASRRVWPRAAAWAITTAAAALAITTVGSLILLACPLPAQVPLVAALGRWQPGAIESGSPVPAWMSVVAAVMLLAIAVRSVRELHAIVSEVTTARRAVRSLRPQRRGDIVIVEDAEPGAHAIPGVWSGGVVLVSTSLLTLVDDDERAAVLAHERSHLRHRHALFLSVVRMAAALNPILAGLRADSRFALERWADEDAAAATQRPVAASALARTALALRGVTAAAVPGLALHRYGTPARVAALLMVPERRVRSAWVLVGAAIIAGLALAWAMHDTERFFEAARLWRHH